MLLLEAGDEEPRVAHVPAFANFLRKSSADWKYETQPEPIACRAYENSVCPIPRGKVMGGSSTINGLIYMRGNREDYNDWVTFGNPGWSYSEVLHYFKKSEDNLDPDVSSILRCKRCSKNLFQFLLRGTKALHKVKVYVVRYNDGADRDYFIL